MNFRINFARLLREERPEKLDQQYRFLKHITTKTAPDNAMMIYFFGLMEKKFIGKISDTTKTRLKERLNNSSYWAEKFDSLNLSFDNVNKEKFPDNISNCGVPNNYIGNTDRFNFPTNKIVNE
jgi:lysyl-tRNA synthetase class I